jgi:hypothetical protein
MWSFRTSLWFLVKFIVNDRPITTSEELSEVTKLLLVIFCLVLELPKWIHQKITDERYVNVIQNSDNIVILKDPKNTRNKYCHFGDEWLIYAADESGWYVAIDYRTRIWDLTEFNGSFWVFYRQYFVGI